MQSSASESLGDLETAVAAATGAPVTALPIDNFPNAVGGWFVDHDGLRFIAVAFDRLFTNEESPEVKRLNKLCRGILCLTLIQTSNSSTPAKELRETAAKLADHVAANGYIDFHSDSWFVNGEGVEDWQEQLLASACHGINRSAPKADYFPWYSLGNDSEVASNRIRIQVGAILEDIPTRDVPPEKTAREDGEAKKVLEQSPTLIPVLSTGDYVK